MPRITDLALGAGAVLAIGLGILVVKPDPAPPGAGGPLVVPSVSTSATASASPSAHPSGKATGSASATPAGDAGSQSTALVVGASAEGGPVMVAERRDCTSNGTAKVAVIDTKGSVLTSDLKGLAAVGGIAVTGHDTASLVGVDTDCKAVGYGTTDAGRTWKALGALPAIWSLIPGTMDQVHAPSGQVDVPCEPGAITGIDDHVARLACTDGRLLGTVSGGDDWSILGNNHDVQAVGFVSATTALALVPDAGCEGVQVERSTDGGTHFQRAHCVEGHGPWGLFTNNDTAVVVGGDTVARSGDDGATWSARQVRS